MSERVQTPMTNEHFAAFCLSMVGQPYWYGTCLYKCTESLRSRKADQYPSHYGSSRTARYRQDISDKKICADCIGAAKGLCLDQRRAGCAGEAIGTDRTYAEQLRLSWLSGQGSQLHVRLRQEQGHGLGWHRHAPGGRRAGAAQGRTRGLLVSETVKPVGVEGVCRRMRQDKGRRARLDELVPAAVYRLWGCRARGNSGNDAPAQTALGGRLLGQGHRRC